MINFLNLKWQSLTSQGYQCELVDPIEYCCSNCSKNTSKVTFCSCCGESYCHDCITYIELNNLLCLVCRKKVVTTPPQIKYQIKYPQGYQQEMGLHQQPIKDQKEIGTLHQQPTKHQERQRRCLPRLFQKEGIHRREVWTRKLQHLKPPLAVYLETYQYGDTTCSLKCYQIIPKNKEEEHAAEQCEVHIGEEMSHQNEMSHEDILILIRRFSMGNFSKEKAKDKLSNWKSPAMYTHVCGYKFCIGIDANGCGDRRGKAVYIHLCAMQGEYDLQLKWPARVKLTIELLHQQGGKNVEHTTIKEWKKPHKPYYRVGGLASTESDHFIEHSKLEYFLYYDTLYFILPNVTIY